MHFVVRLHRLEADRSNRRSQRAETTSLACRSGSRRGHRERSEFGPWCPLRSHSGRLHSLATEPLRAHTDRSIELYSNHGRVDGARNGARSTREAFMPAPSGNVGAALCRSPVARIGRHDVRWRTGGPEVCGRVAVAACGPKPVDCSRAVDLRPLSPRPDGARFPTCTALPPQGDSVSRSIGRSQSRPDECRRAEIEGHVYLTEEHTRPVAASPQSPLKDATTDTEEER
jgi:hypothetical protein